MREILLVLLVLYLFCVSALPFAGYVWIGQWYTELCLLGVAVYLLMHTILWRLDL